MGFMNPTGNGWMMGEPQAMRRLIQLGIEDLNMFGKPLFLHSSPLIKSSSSEFIPTVKIGATIAKLDLDTTAMPANAPEQGLVVVALDPLQKLPDADRLDNVFVQYVTLQQDVTAQLNEPLCGVIWIGKSQGELLL